MDLNELQDAIEAARATLENELEGLRDLLERRVSALEDLTLEVLTVGQDPGIASLQARFLEEREDATRRWKSGCSAAEQSLLEVEQRVWDVAAKVAKEESSARNLEKGPAVDASRTNRDAAPAEFVLKLRQFLSAAENELPTLVETHRKYVMAESVMRSLESVLGESVDDLDDLETALRADWQRELEELGPITKELRSLMIWVEENPENSAGWKRGRRAERHPGSGAMTPRTYEDREPSVVPQLQEPDAPFVDQPEDVDELRSQGQGDLSDFHELTSAELKKYEEDFYRQSELCQILRSTAQTEAHFEEWVGLQAQVETRRQELSVWRKDGGYFGETPSLFAETFKGALPGASHAISKRQDSKNKSKGGSQTVKGEQPRKRKKKPKKRRSSGGRLPFAVWAEDSWGKDPDDLPRDRNVVLGGAMESNRSRH